MLVHCIHSDLVFRKPLNSGRPSSRQGRSETLEQRSTFKAVQLTSRDRRTQPQCRSSCAHRLMTAAVLPGTQAMPTRLVPSCALLAQAHPRRHHTAPSWSFAVFLFAHAPLTYLLSRTKYGRTYSKLGNSARTTTREPKQPPAGSRRVAL